MNEKEIYTTATKIIKENFGGIRIQDARRILKVASNLMLDLNEVNPGSIETRFNEEVLPGLEPFIPDDEHHVQS